MAVLPDAWLLVLKVLIEAPVAWRSPSEIAAALAWREGETTDILCDLDLAGWLSVWETESGPLVTLSALAAERLEVRLVEVGAGGTPRWARAGDAEPPPPRSKNVCLSERAASLEYVSDPDLPPDVSAERGERAEAVARTFRGAPSRPDRREEPPRPTVLVGLSLTPWPGPREPSDAACPACGGLTLGPQAYCLYCDRWGLDRLTPGRAPSPSAPPTPRAVRPEPDRAAAEKAQAERLRALRRSKRKGRHQARRDADRGRKTKPQPPPPTAGPKAEPAKDFLPLHCQPPGKASARAER